MATILKPIKRFCLLTNSPEISKPECTISLKFIKAFDQYPGTSAHTNKRTFISLSLRIAIADSSYETPCIHGLRNPSTSVSCRYSRLSFELCFYDVVRAPTIDCYQFRLPLTLSAPPPLHTSFLILSLSLSSADKCVQNSVGNILNAHRVITIIHMYK